MIRFSALFLVFIISVVVIETNNITTNRVVTHLPLLPDTYKDVFVAAPGGKKTLGSTRSTCWARGGICVDIRHCPSFHIDISVAGCSWGYKVCCKMHQLGSPTVGQYRKSGDPSIRNLNLGGVSLESLAERNTLLLKVLGYVA